MSTSPWRFRVSGLLITAGLAATCCAGAGGEELKYGWRVGEQYAYSFSVTQQSPEATHTWNGGCVLAPTKPPRTRRANDAAPSGSGTGFVINNEGHMVTCAHVVRGTSKIEAMIDGKRVPAKVVAYDRQHDLAVVQVAGQKLSPIALADSDKVELNQDVLAVGYPISDLVGENVKMTRGIISGINKARNSDTDKVFQVDAAINPGNSGGPVVNDSGEVVGVASAKLVIAEVSNVGFVVPSNDVSRLLKDHGIPFEVKAPGDTLKATELGRKVQPSVILLYVTIDPDALEAEKRIMQFHAYVQENSNGAMRSATDEGRFVANMYGETADQTGKKIMPLLTMDVAEMFVNPLAEDGKEKWKSARIMRLLVPVPTAAPPPQVMAPPPQIGPRSSRSRIPGAPGRSSHSHAPGFSGFVRPGAQPSAGQSIVALMAAEITNYEVVSKSGDIVTIKKQYDFSTEAKQGEKALLSVKGTGTLEFDEKAGVPRSFTMDLTQEVSAPGQALSVPIKMHWQRVNPSELRFPDGSPALVRVSPGDAPAMASSVPTPTQPASSSASSSVPGASDDSAKTTELAKPEKQPAPSAAAIAKAQDLVQGLFKKDLDGSKTPAKKLDLARTMLGQAREEKSDMSARYALMDKARQLAADAGALDVAYEAVDAISEGYEVDGMQLKIDTVAALAPAGDAAADKQRAFVKTALMVFDDALEDDRFDVAKRAGSLAMAAARKSNDAKLTQRISEKAQGFKAMQEAFSSTRAALGTLKSDPDNSEANLIAGRYACFYKDEWGAGLKQLAKGSDSALKALAQKEMATQANPDDQLAVADGWYDLADKYASPAKDNLLEHASDWYEKALPGLSGLSKIKAEKRVIAPPVADADDGAKKSGGSYKQQLLKGVRAQFKAKKLLKTQVAGGHVGKEVAVLPSENGGLLVGFEVTYNGSIIHSVQPLYLTDKGQKPGPLLGKPGRQSTKLVAKPGYAVGAMRIRAGLAIDAVSLTYMEIGPKGLKPDKTYQSDWVGGNGGNEVQLGGTGAPVVGVVAHGTSSQVMALGLVLCVPE